MKIRLLLFSVLPAVLLGISFSVQAQNNPSDANLFGTLMDSSGAGVPNVHLTAQLEGDKNAQLWKASSNTDGAYSLSLPPGRYHFSFERAPFVRRDFVIDLPANQQRQLDLHLELEPLNSNVIVTAQAEPTLIDQTTAPVSVITRQEIDERQSVGLADALAFAPGIAIGRTGPEGGTASVFLNGGNSNFTKVLVDGAPINPPGGASSIFRASRWTTSTKSKSFAAPKAPSTAPMPSLASFNFSPIAARRASRSSMHLRRRRHLRLRPRRRANQRPPRCVRLFRRWLLLRNRRPRPQ